MLVISRRCGEWIRLRLGDADVWVQPSEVGKDKVRLCFEAPRDVQITRDELLHDGENFRASHRQRAD